MFSLPKPKNPSSYSKKIFMRTMLLSKSLLPLISILLFGSVSYQSFVGIEHHIDGLVACPPNQIQSLTQFKNEFDSSRCNQTEYFNGAWCDNTTGAITKLRLPSGCLTGILKPNSSLFGFHQLRYLDLSENNFASSSLPSEIGTLYKLEVLSLSNNGFFGQVPTTISNLTSLTELYLDNNQFSGSFPPVQNLTKITKLELSDNTFSGTIPSSLLALPFLSFLELSRNRFSGSIESFNSSTLEFMYLADNDFDGKIIEPISKLTNLKELKLSFLNTNDLIDLNLFASLKYLSALDISGNSISSESLSSDSNILPNLEILVMSECGIREFPSILKTLYKLKLLDIGDNEISGEVPEWLWSRLTRLTTVFINNNRFDGFQGPADVLVNSSVQILVLNSNRFGGVLPLLPLTMKMFSVRNNSFVGEIPKTICTLRSLVFLALAYNNFTGLIPRCLSNLTFVSLRKNNFEGSIPDSFYFGSALRTLDVGFNRITGKLPRSLMNCTSLDFLAVNNNRIKDTFPFWLKALPNLQVLTLRSNEFHGPISLTGPLGFSELRILEVSDNNFTGRLSPSYFENWISSSRTVPHDADLYMQHKDNVYGIVYVAKDAIDLHYKGLTMEQGRVLTSYAAIDFSGNKLEGEIPESIGLLKALIALNLSNNAFTGHIPLSLSNLTELESLDLSRNRLSGTIPQGVKNLSFLTYVNVSYNQLVGEIPQGTQITGQPKSSFEGNADLCGLPLEKSCFTSNAVEEDEEEKVLNWKAAAIGYGPGVLLGLVIAHVVASYKPKWLAKILC